MDVKNRVVSEKKQRFMRALGRWTVDGLYWLSILAVVYVCVQVFLFSSFKIPSDSMAPGLIAGDQVLVCKPIYGARLFNLFATLRNEQVSICRSPGFRNIRRNDVAVFNFPYPHTWDKVEMHILKYYIKRCVGLPGDTLEVRNGFYRVAGYPLPLGNIRSQEKVAAREKASFGDGVYFTFPFDSVTGWNIREFGPLYIPKAGDELAMNRTHYLLYRKLIEWEQGATLTWRDSAVRLNDRVIDTYRFEKNYYFMAGDYTEDSRDSRYWGLLPEEYIVGKAWIIWKSTNPHTGKIRWDRVLKQIQ
jgi:signal peptidase I